MIKGLSDKRRLPRAGKIRLGEKKVNAKGTEYPTAVDYFVWPEEYAQELNQLFGEKCRELPIMFPVEDPEMIAPQFYKRYGSGSGLVCKGDGETATMIDKATGEMEEISCPGPGCEHYISKACRQVMNLQFIIPQLISEGVWQIDTSSYHSIINFNSSWDYVQVLTGGRIAMIPLVLRVVPREVSPDGKKKVVHVLEIKLAERMSLDRLRLVAAQGPAPVAELPAVAEEIAPDDLYPRSLIDPTELAEPPDPADLPEPRHLAEVAELPEIEDPIVEDLARQMGEAAGPSSLELDIEGLMDELGFTQAQRTLRRRKWAEDLDGLLAELLEERDNVKKDPRSGAAAVSPKPRDALPQASKPAPAAPSPLRLI